VIGTPGANRDPAAAGRPGATPASKSAIVPGASGDRSGAGASGDSAPAGSRRQPATDKKQDRKPDRKQDRKPEQKDVLIVDPFAHGN
jgi:hypothetical protein